MNKKLNKNEMLKSNSELSEKAEKLLNVGIDLMDRSKYPEALEKFHKALEISKKSNLLAMQADCLNSIGTIHYFWGDFNKYLSFALDSFKIFEKINDKRGMAKSLINVTVAYGISGRFEELIKVNEKVISIFEELDDEIGLASALGNMAIAYHEIGKYDESLKLSLLSLEYFQKLDEPIREINALINISNLFGQLKQYKKALEYSEKAFFQSEKIDNEYECAVTLYNSGNFLFQLGKIEDSEAKVQKALKIAKLNDFKEAIKDSYLLLSSIYESKKEFEKALENHKLYLKIKEKIFSEKNIKEVSNLRMKFETEQKEKEAEIYRLKNVELVKMMKQLEETQEKLIESEKSKMFFAMVVTANHQLNQPLTVIQMNLEILKRKIWENIDSQDKKYFSTTLESVSRCNSILTKLRNIKNPKYKKYIQDLDMIDLDNISLLENNKETF